MAGGKNNRACGSRHELEVVKKAQAKGLRARKHILSGQLDNSGDITITTGWDDDWAGECKWRSALPTYLTEGIKGVKFVVFRQARGENLVMVRLDDFFELLQ